MVVRPRRLETEPSSTSPSYSGPFLALSSSNRWILPFCLVERALAPRFIHSSSTLKIDWRFRSDASSMAIRSAFSSRKP